MDKYVSDCLLEVCIDSVESAIASQKGGASRVELCENLFEGGTTPSAGCIQVVRKAIDIDLNIMIRPRGGDFLYSPYEYDVMKADIIMAKELGANGVVFGILKADGSVDIKRCETLIKISKPLSVTFHRAFDMTPNPYEALKDLLDMGVDRLLTSGQESTAFEGAELIVELVKRAKNSLIIMPGGGITERNIGKIAQITHCKEFHVTGRISKQSDMTYLKKGVYMGGALRMEEYLNYFTDAERIRAIKNQL